MELKDIRKVYFVGIGGIGMSALARYFNDRSVEVWGYDRTETSLTKTLVKEGMYIHYDESVEKIPEGIDLVVYTPAVPQSHKALQFFLAHRYPLYKRAEVLGIISRGMKTVAVGGTHGKTTTSSMVTHLLRSGGVDCTAFLGGIAQNLGSNFVSGKSDWVVVEADEYDRSFLHLDPDHAVILSMDADHLDIYGDREAMLETGFKAFARKLKTGGQLWVQQRLLPYFQNFSGVKDFGVEVGHYRATNIRVEEGSFVFDYESPDNRIPGLQLPHPGRHNVENATAAVSIALQIGVTPEAIREGLASFAGIKRRFERVFQNDRVVYIDDYAHHPTELKAVIEAARELFPGREITGVFQPHLYSRTRDFAEGFAESLDLLDEVILMDIYPARELPMPGVSSEMIFDQMTNENKVLTGKAELMDELRKRDPEVIMTLGAGDIDTFVESIRKWLTERESSIV